MIAGTHTLTVRRVVSQQGSDGGWNETYQDSHEIQGRIRPARGSERSVAAKDQGIVTHVAYCSTAYDVVRKDQITDGELVVEVLTIRKPGGIEHHLEVDCREVQ